MEQEELDVYIAHKRKSENEEQSFLDHLNGTAIRPGDFAEAFNNKEYVFMCEILHDLGKYSDKFQNRIKNNGKKCHHSSAGARIINKNHIFGKLGAYCIAGHHSGLQNFGDITDVGGEGTLCGRLAKDYSIPCFESYKEEITKSQCTLQGKPIIKPLRKGGFSFFSNKNDVFRIS